MQGICQYLKSKNLILCFFSYNSIDYVSHEDRVIIWKEINRVLKQSGIFVFSSHNYYKPQNINNIKYSYNILSFLRGLLWYTSGITNHLKLKKHEIYSQNYSIINDGSNNYKLLVYYINKEYQVKQLKEIGFNDIKMVNIDGKFIDVSSIDKSPWVYYIAKKQIF